MWAQAHLDYLTGRLIAKGVDPASLSARDWLDLAFAEWVDSIDGLVDRYDVLVKLRGVLATPLVDKPQRPEDKRRAEEEMRRNWGRDPKAQAEMRAMMAIAPARSATPSPAVPGRAP